MKEKDTREILLEILSILKKGNVVININVGTNSGVINFGDSHDKN